MVRHRKFRKKIAQSSVFQKYYYTQLFHRQMSVNEFDEKDLQFAILMFFCVSFSIDQV